MTKQKQSVALVVTQPPSLTPAEHQMFDSIAMRYARSELSPSWARGKPDNVFIAMVNGHALGLHPAVAVNNGFVVNGHYDLFGQAFLGLAQGRDPSFRFEIEEWDEEHIKVVGWREPDGAHHEISLTRAQLAKNPVTAKNPSFASNPKEHLLWKASKRLVRLVTPAVTMGLPLPTEEQVETTPEAPKPKDVENVLEEALGPTTATSTWPTQPQSAESEGATPPPDPVLSLSARIRNAYGALSKKDALAKASLIYTEMKKAGGGPAKEYVFKTVADIGPEAAAEMLAWLDERDAQREERGKGTEEGDGAASTEPDGGTEPAPAREPGDDDEPPPAEEQQQAQPAAEPFGWEAFMRVVIRARKLFGTQDPITKKWSRQFVMEAPPKSGKLWYVDQDTFSKLGYANSIKLQDGGALAMEAGALEALGQVLADACDAAERKGR